MLKFKEIEYVIKKQRSIQDYYNDYDERQKIQIRINCLVHNRTIIIENAIIQDICNILNGYSGKKIGPKTKEKIINEVNNLPFIKDNNLRVYLDDSIMICYTTGVNSMYSNVYMKALTKNIFLDLKYNKIYNIEDLEINDRFKYIDDIEDYIKQINLAKENVYNKFNELQKIVNDYNILNNNQYVSKYIELSIRKIEY